MGIFNRNKKDNDYAQSELREFYYKRMNEKEIKKIKELNLDEEIKKIQNSNYQIKYIDSIGYVFIGEGYAIMKDGTEPTHYFAKIYNTQRKAKKAILNEYNEKVANEEKKTIGSIRKTMLNENGTSYEVEEKIIIPDSEQEAKKFTLEQMIKENAGPDPFWEDCINDFFNNVNKTEDEKIEFFKNLSLDQHLFNEFTREIVKSLNKDQIFEKYNKLLNNKNVDEFILKIKEYTVSYENENRYSVLITNEKIQINNEQVKEDITAKVNKIKNIVLDNLNEIDKISNSVQHNYKGGRQEKIDIRINGKDYYIIGNTSNEEAVKLYSILKEKIYKTINSESVVEKNIPSAIKRILKCPNCGARLTYLMPSGSYLSCEKCKKIYTNEKGHVGHETNIDYDKNSNILY